VACQQLPRTSSVDARVLQAVQLIRGNKHYKMSELAHEVGLSYYRLSHAFARNLGITLRAFVQWKKVTVTASLLAHKSITEAAHEAGFTDSAHLSRLFKDVYGLPPSYLNNPNCVERFYYMNRGSS
jgi:AraC-like DNA-binding protein